MRTLPQTAFWETRWARGGAWNTISALHLPDIFRFQRSGSRGLGPTAVDGLDRRGGPDPVLLQQLGLVQVPGRVARSPPAEDGLDPHRRRLLLEREHPGLEARGDRGPRPVTRFR